MFKPYHQNFEKTVTIEFEGIEFRVPDTITVAAAVLSYAGENHTSISPVSAKKRAPHCFMGICYECLMEINGIPDQQACIVKVEEGMKINRQLGFSGGGEL
ncbi:MAG: (2Fe-2S)-binding protein [SAR324 cluster bacterium]|nr:(2Fe-2S)-binding protein [SAR324 cluster bacterium]